jgi:hypothetical protein
MQLCQVEITPSKLELLHAPPSYMAFFLQKNYAKKAVRNAGAKIKSISGQRPVECLVISFLRDVIRLRRKILKLA